MIPANPFAFINDPAPRTKEQSLKLFEAAVEQLWNNREKERLEFEAEFARAELEMSISSCLTPRQGESETTKELRNLLIESRDLSKEIQKMERSQ